MASRAGRRRKAQNRRARRVVSFAAFAVCAFYAFFGGEYPAQELVRLHMRHATALSGADSTEREVAGLKKERDRLTSDPVVLERLGREKYGLTRSDEVIYRFVNTSDTSE